MVPYFVRISNNHTEIPARQQQLTDICKIGLFWLLQAQLRLTLAAGLRPWTHTCWEISLLTACFCVKYSTVYFLWRIQAIEIVSEAFWMYYFWSKLHVLHHATSKKM